MSVEVFYLFQTCLIIRSSIIRRFNNLIVREIGFGVLVRKVVDTLNYQKWRNTPTFAINTSNRCCLFLITWLYSLSSTTSIGTCNNHPRCNHAHHKASLIKVVEIAIQNAIFCLYILYQLEPSAN
jgi:hypothetical protein